MLFRARRPHLGHPGEFHEKTREPFFHSMPLWEAVEGLAASASSGKGPVHAGPVFISKL